MYVKTPKRTVHSKYFKSGVGVLFLLLFALATNFSHLRDYFSGAIVMTGFDNNPYSIKPGADVVTMGNGSTMHTLISPSLNEFYSTFQVDTNIYKVAITSLADPTSSQYFTLTEAGNGPTNISIAGDYLLAIYYESGIKGRRIGPLSGTPLMSAATSFTSPQGLATSMLPVVTGSTYSYIFNGNDEVLPYGIDVIRFANDTLAEQEVTSDITGANEVTELASAVIVGNTIYLGYYNGNSITPLQLQVLDVTAGVPSLVGGPVSPTGSAAGDAGLRLIYSPSAELLYASWYNDFADPNNASLSIRQFATPSLLEENPNINVLPGSGIMGWATAIDDANNRIYSFAGSSGLAFNSLTLQPVSLTQDVSLPGGTASSEISFAQNTLLALADVAGASTDYQASLWTIADLPVANAGTDQTASGGVQVTLDGSASTASGSNTINSYTWVQTSGTSVMLTGANTVSPTFTPTTSGTYVFSLVVADDGGGSPSNADTISITVTVPASGTFSSQTTPTVLNGTQPFSIVTTDFNIDGSSDLAIAYQNNGASGAVKVFTNDGTGTFSELTAKTVGTTPYTLVADDFNGDNYPGLIVTNFGSIEGTGGLSVLLNTGGTFANQVSYDTGIGPKGIAHVDYLPGIPGSAYAIIGNFTAGTATIFGYDNSNGIFSTLQTTAGATAITGIEYVDMDGGGSSNDLLSIGSTQSPSLLSVTLGGVTGAPIEITSASAEQFLVLDLENDSDNDIAVINQATSGTLSLFTNDGAGGLTLSGTLTAGNMPGWGATGDFDNDGDTDIAVTNSLDDNVSIFLSNGNGTFASAVNYSVGDNPQWIAAADYNGDGRIDLAVTNKDDGTVSLLYGKSPTPPIANAGPPQSGVEIGALVTLDGTASTDADYDTLTYAWTKTSGPTATLSSATAAQPTFTVSTGGTYIFSLTVNDGGENSTADTVSIIANATPTITSNGGGSTATINAAENQTAITTVVATDADALDTITYSISGGEDQFNIMTGESVFSIGSSSGILTFGTAPDYETPGAASGTNIYEVIVQVSDGNGGTDTQTITITVTDVVEGGGITRRALTDTSINSSSTTNTPSGTITSSGSTATTPESPSGIFTPTTTPPPETLEGLSLAKQTDPLRIIDYFAWEKANDQEISRENQESGAAEKRTFTFSGALNLGTVRKTPETLSVREKLLIAEQSMGENESKITDAVTVIQENISITSEDGEDGGLKLELFKGTTIERKDATEDDKDIIIGQIRSVANEDSLTNAPASSPVHLLLSNGRKQNLNMTAIEIPKVFSVPEVRESEKGEGTDPTSLSTTEPKEYGVLLSRPAKITIPVEKEIENPIAVRYDDVTGKLLGLTQIDRRGSNFVLTTDGFSVFVVLSRADAISLGYINAVPTFTDLTGDYAWSKPFVTDLADRYIVNGKSEGMFSPGENITRAELTKIALLNFGFTIAATGTVTGFTDTPSTHWSAATIRRGRETGVVSGYPDGTFKPDKPVTRAEAMKILITAAQVDISNAPKQTLFPDVDSSQWYTPYVGYAEENSIASGYPDGTFGPSNPITRAAVAKVAVNLRAHLFDREQKEIPDGGNLEMTHPDQPQKPDLLGLIFSTLQSATASIFDWMGGMILQLGN